METYNIWMEGYVVTGDYGTHSLLGTSKGNTFKEAVVKWVNNHPDYKSLFDENRLTIWGCKLYPTEEEAKRGFG